MANCFVCRKVRELHAPIVNGETDMSSSGNTHQPPTVNPTVSVSLNLTLATTVYPPQPSSPPPQLSASLALPRSPSSPPPLNGIDFLGTGSV